MTRISRISTPRATLAAFALIAIVMAGFGMFADGGESPATREGQVANQAVEQPATETSHHCQIPTSLPLVAVGRRLENDHDVQL